MFAPLGGQVMRDRVFNALRYWHWWTSFAQVWTPLHIGSRDHLGRGQMGRCEQECNIAPFACKQECTWYQGRGTWTPVCKHPRNPIIIQQPWWGGICLPPKLKLGSVPPCLGAPPPHKQHLEVFAHNFEWWGIRDRFRKHLFEAWGWWVILMPRIQLCVGGCWRGLLDDDWIGAVLANGGRHAFLEMVAPKLVFCINIATQTYI